MYGDGQLPMENEYEKYKLNSKLGKYYNLCQVTTNHSGLNLPLPVN